MVNHVTSDAEIVSLDVTGSAQLTNETVKQFLQTHASITKLVISGCWRLNESIFEFTRQPSLKSSSYLCHLDLSDLPHLDDLMLRTIAQSSSTRRLKTLNVARCKMITDSGIKALTRLRHLQSLNLNYCVSVRGISFQTLLSKCETLKSLRADGLHMIEDRAIRSIAAREASFGYGAGTGGVVSLEQLSLCNCRRRALFRRFVG